MLTMAKVWSVISNELHSTHMPYKYDLSFLSPVYAGDQITLHFAKKENKIDLKGTFQEKTVVKGSILLRSTY
jgi:3-hydroxymyristoyl/3-hydroxydecanoyl-(acyl carrier protein) dehydratase